MKLVEILAWELKAWPRDLVLVQTHSGLVYEAGGIGKTIGSFKTGSDWRIAEVTRAHWEAERARIAAMEMQDEFKEGDSPEEIRDQHIAELKRDQQAQYEKELWDRVAIASMNGLISCNAFHGYLYQQNPENAAIFGADCADAFMAERAKRRSK